MQNEARTVLLGHRKEHTTTHYSTPELQVLSEVENRIWDQQSDTTQALVVCKKKLVSAWCSLSVWPLGRKIGALERIRTSDRLVRSQVLYPAELRARQGREY